ncbi:MAG: hypothetical protein GY714_18725 [Desulfobacterales bacterium]|nr:hypothetical protein [Desulfobacterales bacterium]MCP4163476.1 hypothetical protein [Deltaproteobacteria bacterium]
MDSKNLRDIILGSKGIKIIKWTGIIWCSTLLLTLLIYILFSYDIMTNYLKYLLLDIGYPIYILIIGSTLGVPLYSISRFWINNYDRGKAIFYIVTGLVFLSIFTCVPEYYLSIFFPVFTQFLNCIFLLIIMIFGIYAIISKYLNQNKKHKTDGYK